MFIRVLLISIVAVAIVPAQRGARGSNTGGNSRNNDPFGNQNRGMNNPRGNNQQRERRMKSRFDDLASRLNLEKDQKKQIRSLFEQASKEAEPIRQEMQKQNREIYEAVKTGKSE